MNQNGDDLVAVRDDERTLESVRAQAVGNEKPGAALYRSERYQWPVRTQTGDAAAMAYADLMVETGHERDGTMTTWQYRARLEHEEASSVR